MNREILPVESIQERDVDLILLEELCTDDDFCEWFIDELGLPKNSKNTGAWRSISDFGLGETDILFSYYSSDKKIFVLIENKIDASFQEEQSGRYLKRAEKYISEKKCDQAFTVLVAPDSYCESQSEFENYLSYESIINRLEFTGSKRNIFKGKLLKIAVEKSRRGYQPVNSLPVQQFWHSYWVYQQERQPNLIMKKPGIVPIGSDWPMLFDNDFKNVVFYHKLGQGNADVTFKGFPQEAAIKIEEKKPEWAQFIKHGKSFSLRIFSGKIDRMQKFSTQLTPVENGLKNLGKLQNWMKENKNWLQQWL